MLITDPPYEFLRSIAIGTTTRQSKASNLWFTIFPNALFHVLRRNSHLYLFCGSMWHAVRRLLPVRDKVALGMGSIVASVHSVFREVANENYRIFPAGSPESYGSLTCCGPKFCRRNRVRPVLWVRGDRRGL